MKNILLTLFFFPMIIYAESDQTSLSKEELTHIINEQLLGNVDAINSTISNYLTVFGILLAIGSLILSFGVYFKKKELDQKIQEYVEKQFNQEFHNVIKEVNKRANILIGRENTKLKKEYQKEEYLRNFIFYDLNKILSSELSNGKNLSEIFNLHADRIYLITQLTSGEEKKITKALRQLSIGNYDKITRLDSFGQYISFLKDTDISAHLLEQIDNLEQQMAQ